MAFAAVAAALGALLARSVRRVEVAGASMIPALDHGDRLVVVRGLRVRAGDVVAVRDPRDEARILVKRATSVWPDGSVDVHGDNPGASTDSRDFGPVERRLVVGRAVWRYWPEEHRGRIT